jgi:DNA-binding MarR family transcriptional regulator
VPTALAADLSDAEYAQLLAFRNAMRRFLRWSEEQATGSLLLRHHSAVGLVDRAVAANLVERHSDSEDHRIVRLRLTALGTRRLRQLAGLHLAELRRMMPVVAPALLADQAEHAKPQDREEGEA